MRISAFLFVVLLSWWPPVLGQQPEPPLELAIVGLTHTHVHWLLGRPKANDLTIVGIVEPNRELAQRYAEQHGYSMDLVYDTLEELIAAKDPDAVAAFGSIYDHLEVVQVCAPKGIHVMVEKPLAVSLAHAKKMEALAKKHRIILFTNYETTWYPANHQIKKWVDNGQLGPLRKVVVHDGHQGPKEIGVNQEFLDWLTDPKLNGGGALMDFGCYGANLITWLQNGQRPTSVLAVTQQIKPEVYPKVDDEATIILTYPKMQGIIQASWNWPISRKDMEVYGKEGYAIAPNGIQLRYQLTDQKKERQEIVSERIPPLNDPFALFSGMIRYRLSEKAYALSSLENNMIVMEILEAAKKSAKTGKAVSLD